MRSRSLMGAESPEPSLLSRSVSCMMHPSRPGEDPGIDPLWPPPVCVCIAGYDTFRENFLHARSDLMESVPIRKDGKMVWIDVGGGTARNLEFIPVRPREQTHRGFPSTVHGNSSIEVSVTGQSLPRL
jgi:hypothetical protein